eukprot:scaffold98245_cov48-Phaeocystis_antarctica.AAC.1
MPPPGCARRPLAPRDTDRAADLDRRASRQTCRSRARARAQSRVGAAPGAAAAAAAALPDIHPRPHVAASQAAVSRQSARTYLSSRAGCLRWLSPQVRRLHHGRSVGARRGELYPAGARSGWRRGRWAAAATTAAG